MARPRGARNPRRARQRRSYRATGTYKSTAGMAGGGELLEAAKEIGSGAQLIASSFSKTIPESMSIEGDEHLLTISFDAPPAYPAETRASHPLFATGPRETWTWRDREGRPFGPPGKKFLQPAIEQRADPALRKYAEIVDRLCRERGFR